MDMTCKALSACLLTSVLAIPAAGAPAATQYGVLHNFTAQEETTSGLLADKSGVLYGVTQYGGADNAGTVFQLGPDGTYTLLYSFTGGNDGYQPDGPLTKDKSGNLYGTTFEGGAAGKGVVFKIAPDGTETVLHTFMGGADDGAMPHGGVVAGSNGDLFGATQAGGPKDYGTVFVLHKSGEFKVLHAFSGADGFTPEATVTLDKSGNLYGTTLWGGAHNVGTVYKVAPDGSHSVLYSFENGSDGGEPASPVTLDKSGNLYGTTLIGGRFTDGVVFKVTPSGTEEALHAFSGKADGDQPYGSILIDNRGNLYGTTSRGGANNWGVVFKIGLNGKEKVLHAFAGGTDGGLPFAGLIFDRSLDGDYMYGTTVGTIFKIKK